MKINKTTSEDKVKTKMQPLTLQSILIPKRIRSLLKDTFHLDWHFLPTLFTISNKVNEDIATHPSKLSKYADHIDTNKQ